MKITFYGAAGRVTGSKHLVTTANNEKILLDCGMFQGEGEEGNALNRNFGFDPRLIDFVILSHAHIDHTGLLPRLVKLGFQGKIYCNSSTRDLCELMLADSAHIQESDLERVNTRRERKGLPPLEPLYDVEDVEKTIALMQVVKNEQKFVVGKNTEVVFSPTAHILGSVAITLFLKENEKETVLTFTGDIGRPGDQILDGPDCFPLSDYIICESTYGDRLHAPSVDASEKLLQIVQETCVEKRGKIIIPAFSIDRTQEIIYMLDKMEHEKKLPPIKVYVDSPLSVKATEVMNRHRDDFNQQILEYITKDGNPFDFPTLKYISKVEESKKINSENEPCIIISASGMAEAGRIKHHIANNIENSNNTILIVGYATPDSLAGKIKRGYETVRIFGEDYKLNANVEIMDNFSAHADYNEMLSYLSCQNKEKIKNVFLVHGDEDALAAWKSRLLENQYKTVTIAQHGETVNI